VRSHLYQCPDLNFPFLGIHLSRTFDGRVLAGPGAVLTLGRESYRRFAINLKECLDMFRYPGFRRMFLERALLRMLRIEWKKSLFMRAVANEAKLLVPGLNVGDFVRSRAGIRAQLVSRDGNMVDDLIVEQTPLSIQILNAISPALTCSLPFADHLSEIALGKL
jgi:(S)-2-hydroxyglutarate dehydrogenase